ncbi:MAG: hypothetical protein A2046_08015 [Bacteroidetes bacterium GWA2_30_7]|nr:MAG: hypothetical protein A2046_08015 [Bacteroidetes bacterium GWA2_30_7]
MKKKIIAIGLIVTSIVTIQSCKKDKADKDADKELYSEITAGGYSYYQNGTLLSGVSPSPHGSFKLRFNATASAALDSTGELPTGSSFSTGSIIVKEIFSGSSINLYAVMKKDPSNGNAGSGWVWAEFKTDGSAAFSTSKKGDGCISCHSGSPNRDLTKTFDLH